MGGSSDLTLSGQILGTPGYLAPEQARGQSHRAGPAVDVYGVGAILYHLLTGRPPFVGEDPLAVLRQVERGDPPSLRLLNPGIPLELEAVTLKCLAREPERRYAGAAEIAEEMRRWLGGRPVLAKPAGRSEKFARWVRRNPALAAALAAITLLATGTIATILFANRRIEGLRGEAVERLYTSDMRLALQNIAEGKYGAAAALIDRHDPAKGAEDLRGFEWYLARQLCASDEAAALEPMNGQVRALAWSPDGKWIAAGADDLRVRETGAGRPVLRHSAPGQTRALAFTADSRRLAIGQTDGEIFVCDPAAADAPLFSAQLTTEATAIAWRADGAALEIFAGRRQWRWTPGGGEPSPVADLPGDALRPFVNARGQFAAFLHHESPGTEAVRLAIWNVARSESMADLAVSRDRVLRSFACSADGRWLATGDYTGRLTLRESPFAATAWDDVVHRGKIDQVAFSPDGRLLATTGDQVIHVFEKESHTRIGTLRGHRGMILALAFSPDGTALISGDQRGEVKLWKTPRLAEPETPPAAAQAEPGAFVSPDGKWLVVSDSVSGVPKLTDRSGRRPPIPLSDEKNAAPAAFSADSRRCAIGFRNGSVRVHDVATGAEVRTFPAHRAWAYATMLSADGRILATAGFDGMARLWEVASGKMLREFSSNADSLWSVTLSPDGTRLAAGTSESIVILWDTANGLETGAVDLGFPRRTIETLLFAPDGESLTVNGRVLPAPRGEKRGQVSP